MPECSSTPSASTKERLRLSLQRSKLGEMIIYAASSSKHSSHTLQPPISSLQSSEAASLLSPCAAA